MIHLDWTFVRPGHVCAARREISVISALTGPPSDQNIMWSAGTDFLLRSICNTSVLTKIGSACVCS